MTVFGQDADDEGGGGGDDDGHGHGEDIVSDKSMQQAEERRWGRRRRREGRGSTKENEDRCQTWPTKDLSRESHFTDTNFRTMSASI